MLRKTLNKRTLLAVPVLVATLALAATSCGPAPAISRAAAPSSGPDAVAQEFYAWYLGDARQEGNPLVNGAYVQRTELSADLITNVQDQLAAMERGGGDPFLCAQDIPSEIRFEDAQTADGRATVIAHGVWNAGTAYETTNVLTLTLVEDTDGAWTIDAIACR
jgi:hypothetical protein